MRKSRLDVFLDKENYNFVEVYARERDIRLSQAVNRIVGEYRLNTSREMKRKDYQKENFRSNLVEKKLDMILDVLNSQLFDMDAQYTYISMDQLQHPLLSKAQEAVDKRMARLKQIKDTTERKNRKG